MNSNNILYQALDTTRIVVRSPISSKKRLLEEVAHLLTSGLNQDAKEKEVYHLLLEREKIGNTGVGAGVALPHSRCDYTDKPIAAIVTLQEAIDYDSIDHQNVGVAFSLLVPQHATQEHLNLLADIARMMSDNSKRHALTSAKSAEDVMQLIQHWQ